MQEELDYKKLIEAALFVTSRAMSASELADAAGIASVGAVNGFIEEISREYEQRNGAIGIFKIGDKYIMSIREPYAGKVSNLAGAPDMSKGALRILAFVSKNEPVMQSAVVKAFGSTTYDYMKELLEKEFIKTQKSGRSKKIETTEKFKEYFNF